MKPLTQVFDAVGRFAASLAVFLLLALVACGPGAAGPNATPREASVVIMADNVLDDNVTVVQVPVCMGVAVSTTLIVTSAHCAAHEPAHIVDFVTWYTTSQGLAYADTAAVIGEARLLVPRVPLLSWATVAEATDGPGVFVAVRGSDIAEVPTVLNNGGLTGDIDHTESGAGVFRDGRAVGFVEACNSTNDKDCDLPGGRFVGIP